MKKIIFAVLSIISMITSPAYADDAGEIKKVFQGYIEAAISSDGEAAADAFSESAYGYWNSILNDAKCLSRGKLERQSVYRLFNIVLIRKRIQDDLKIAAMDGRSLLVHSYSKGWNSKRALKYIHDKKDIVRFVTEVRGTSAELKIELDGEILPAGFPLIKEHGHWKIDGKEQFEQLEKNIEIRVENSGKSKRAFIDAMFKGLFGEALSDKLWQPDKKYPCSNKVIDKRG